MGYYILFALFVGGILTLNDVYHDLVKNERLTLNLPITITMHALLGIPMLSIFMVVALVNEIKKKGK